MRGADQSLVEAINSGRAPEIADPREAMAHTVAREMLQTRKLSDSTYQAASKLFGETELVCLISTVGQYSMTCLTTIGFDVTPPDDVPHRLKPASA